MTAPVTDQAPAPGSLRAVDEILTRAAAASPDQACIIVPDGETLTYGALDRRASAFARVLRGQGYQPGDRLVLANCNTPNFFVALFGGLRAGMIAAPVDAGLGALELRNVLAHGRPRAVVVDRRSAAAFAAFDGAVCALEPDAGVPWHDLDQLAVSAAEPSDARPVERPEGAIILYTSGTTASPKGVLHGHAGILSKLAAIQSWFALDRETTALCLLPTHFGHGLVASCLATFNAGGTLVLCRPFDLALLQRLFALVEQYRVNVLSTVPTIIRLLLRFAQPSGQASGAPRSAPASLRFITCASAPLHPDEVEAFEARFGVPLLNCYGITEGGTWSAMSPPDGTRDRRSVGTAHGCRMRAVDQAGAPLPPGEIGNLEIAGPSVMLGYYLDPETTARTIVNGWLATGDLGHVDGEGRVFLAGRSKELIIRAGANVYPAEVEAALISHPAVAEAYVVGLDHPILGERVAACVILRADCAVSRDQLIAHCRERLAHYKCPEEIKLVDAVPKTSRGKVSRASLKAVFGERSAALPGAGADGA